MSVIAPVKKISIFKVKRDSVYAQIEDSDTKYDNQLSEFGEGKTMNVKLQKHCKAMKTSDNWSMFTKIGLYSGALIQASLVCAISIANITGIWANTVTTVAILITVGISLGIPLCLVSTLTTGCFPDCSSDSANVKQNSYGKLKAYFNHLAWRIMRRYYEFEQDEAVQLCTKIFANCPKLHDDMAYYIGNSDAKDIMNDLMNAVHYIQSDNENEKKRIFREWVNEEIKSYITSQIQIHNLTCGLREIMLDIINLKEKLQMQPSQPVTPRETSKETPITKPNVNFRQDTEVEPVNVEVVEK